MGNSSTKSKKKSEHGKKGKKRNESGTKNGVKATGKGEKPTRKERVVAEEEEESEERSRNERKNAKAKKKNKQKARRESSASSAGDSSQDERENRIERSDDDAKSGSEVESESVKSEVESESEDSDWEKNQTLVTTGDVAKVTKNDFEILKLVGKGSFGKVFLVKKRDTGKIYAMKVLRKEAIIQRKQVTHTKAERNILQRIQHPFIVKLYFAFQTREKLYMVLDYINGGELFFHLKREGRFTEDRVRFYAAEIVMALQHLHGLGIVYRDLKPENILLDNTGNIIITDFGLSKELTKDGDSTTTFCGTPEYLAPEVLKGKGHGTAVDWWSLGTLLYEMLTGLPPFYSQNVGVMYQKVLNSELKFPAYMSVSAKALLAGLLTRDPKKRLGNTEEDIRKHPWFKGIDWDALVKKQVSAPFVPKVHGKDDVNMIDPAFTAEPANDSLVENNLSESVLAANAFDNFTFENTTALEAGTPV